MGPNSHPSPSKTGIDSVIFTGTSTLIVGNQKFSKLSFQIDLDLGHLEYSISRLESQVYSISVSYSTDGGYTFL